MNNLKKVSIKNDDGEWYVIPSMLSEIFDECLSASGKSEGANDHFIDMFSQYHVGDNLNKVQLFAEI